MHEGKNERVKNRVDLIDRLRVNRETPHPVPPSPANDERVRPFLRLEKYLPQLFADPLEDAAEARDAVLRELERRQAVVEQYRAELASPFKDVAQPP